MLHASPAAPQYFEVLEQRYPVDNLGKLSRIHRLVNEGFYDPVHDVTERHLHQVDSGSRGVNHLIIRMQNLVSCAGNFHDGDFGAKGIQHVKPNALRF